MGFILILMLLFVIINNKIIVHNGVLVIFYIPIIFYFSVSQGIIANIFARKEFVFLGEISYGLYILQFPVYIPFQRILTAYGLDSNVIFYTCTTILILASIISFKYFERPLRNWIKKISTQ